MEFVSKYSDVFLAAMVVLVMGMLIIPMPTFLIDVFLTINVAFGITILLVVLYISSAIRLASFPSLLLIGTLFRLGLNVSTTRLILLQGDAGKMVQSFGSFVVQGNMIVGAIIFLILTLINFIVISKGSERVAEVSARFTLDAMPGKQMAIDADLRGGAFDMSKASSLRRNLSRESQLFGAMDGAMKFVKGDAIAGIIITCVNILGGVSVGIIYNQMTGLEALQHYGLLTIGDGLLSQIPSLIISAAAGLMVTRVEPEFKGNHLAKDIGFQLLSYPKALLIVSIILFVLGTIPGLPIVPFWLISGLMGITSWFLSRCQAVDRTDDNNDDNDLTKENGVEETLILMPVPITLELSKQLIEHFSLNNPDNKLLNDLIPEIRSRIHQDLGIKVPGVRIRELPGTSESSSFEIRIMETPVCAGMFPLDQGLIVDGDSRLLARDTPCIPPENWQCKGILVEESLVLELKDTGYTVYSGIELIAYILEQILRKHVSEFLGLQEVKWMCDELERYYPDSIQEVIPQKISYCRLRDILQRLVQEEVNIRNLKLILETLSEYAELEPDNTCLADRIRVRLGRQISHCFSTENVLNVFILEDKLEERFKQSIRLMGTERMLALSPDQMDKIFSAFSHQFSRHRSVRNPVVMTVDNSIRYVLWRFLSHKFSSVRVLSAQEIPSGFRFNALGQVVLEN